MIFGWFRKRYPPDPVIPWIEPPRRIGMYEAVNIVNAACDMEERKTGVKIPYATRGAMSFGIEGATEKEAVAFLEKAIRQVVRPSETEGRFV